MQFLKDFQQKLGPGLLYAGAAIGVSHLVQSTRAGAQFGFELLIVIILSHFFKYPFFEYGPRYTAITGKSLLEGYEKLGKWAVWLFLVMTIGTMFTIQAAVTVVTAGLAENIFSFGLSPAMWSAILLLVCLLLLGFGHYSFLDKIIKPIILILTVTTIISVLAALTKGYAPVSSKSFEFSNKNHLFFLIAFMGWMPAPLDISVWHSMWAVAKNQTVGRNLGLKETLFDFKVGFYGTAFLAMGFLSLGALVMYSSGASFASGAVGFAGQLIKLYTENLGSWSYPFIAVAALTTMFSTTLTCLDAFPRVLRKNTQILFPQFNDKERSLYWVWIIITVGGALFILFNFMKNMKDLVDFATSISFITAPVIAWLNIKVMDSSDIPLEARPHGAVRILGWVGLTYLVGFSVYYVYLKY